MTGWVWVVVTVLLVVTAVFVTLTWTENSRMAAARRETEAHWGAARAWREARLGWAEAKKAWAREDQLRRALENRDSSRPGEQA